MIEPYKRRTIKPHEDVWAYRNLMRTEGVWYSLMQRGLVVGHAREVAMTGARLIVREAGRQRVVASGVKNVHAFVVGRLFGADPTSFGVPGVSALRARYNPFRAPTFEYEAGGDWLPVLKAAGVHLGPAGLTVWGVAYARETTRQEVDPVAQPTRV